MTAAGHGWAGAARMHTRVWGGVGPARPPAVLVHGLGMSGRYLAPTAERLAADFRVYAPDLPGFGRTRGRTAPST